MCLITTGKAEFILLTTKVNYFFQQVYWSFPLQPEREVYLEWQCPVRSRDSGHIAHGGTCHIISNADDVIMMVIQIGGC